MISFEDQQWWSLIHFTKVVTWVSSAMCVPVRSRVVRCTWKQKWRGGCKCLQRSKHGAVDGTLQYSSKFELLVATYGTFLVVRLQSMYCGMEDSDLCALKLSASTEMDLNCKCKCKCKKKIAMKVDCECAGALVEATNGMVCGKKNDQCCCSASRDPHQNCGL